MCRDGLAQLCALAHSLRNFLSHFMAYQTPTHPSILNSSSIYEDFFGYLYLNCSLLLWGSTPAPLSTEHKFWLLMSMPVPCLP